jgi:hypothetical protein
MAMELYWSQHKVFFIATLVLFPDRLNGHEVNQWFYRPYFVSDDPDFIEIELEDYQKAGYLKYEKPSSLYKITDIDTEKAKKDLMLYLKQWQHNELLALSANKPPDPVRQKELLLAAIVHDYPDHKNEQRITLEDVYGKPNSYAYKPPFWELVLAYQLLAKKIKITYMDYDRRDDGLYDDGGQPTADFKIIDKELISLIEQQVAQKAEHSPPIMPANIVAEQLKSELASCEAHVFMRGLDVCITIAGDKIYAIAKLGNNTSHHKFMQHILTPENNDIDIAISEINGLEDLKAAHSLTELARYCGFIKPFKKAFFITSNKEKIHFRSAAQLDDKQVEAVKKQAAKLEAKNRK